MKELPQMLASDEIETIENQYCLVGAFMLAGVIYLLMFGPVSILLGIMKPL